MQAATAIGTLLFLLAFLVAIIQVTWPWSLILIVLCVLIFAALRLGKRKYQQMLWFRAEAKYLSAKCDDDNAAWLKSVITEAKEYERNERDRRMRDRRDERWRRGAEREGCTVDEYIERERQEDEARRKRYLKKLREAEIEKAREETNAVIVDHQGKVVKRY